MIGPSADDILLTLEYVVGVDPSVGRLQRTVPLARTVEQLAVLISGPLRRVIHHQVTPETCGTRTGVRSAAARRSLPAHAVITWPHVLRAAGQDAVLLWRLRSGLHDGSLLIQSHTRVYADVPVLARVTRLSVGVKRPAEGLQDDTREQDRRPDEPRADAHDGGLEKRDVLTDLSENSLSEEQYWSPKISSQSSALVKSDLIYRTFKIINHIMMQLLKMKQYFCFYISVHNHLIRTWQTNVQENVLLKFTLRKLYFWMFLNVFFLVIRTLTFYDSSNIMWTLLWMFSERKQVETFHNVERTFWEHY